jgi:thioredoxin-dependent peroxiredoxin
MLKPGDPAPKFSTPDETGKTRTLDEFRGKTVLLWFYPKADTPGCTAEGCGFRDRIGEFEKLGVVVLGASFDTQQENAAFKKKFSFPYPLLCDTTRALGVAYGAAADAKAKSATRCATLIGKDQKIVEHWPKVDAREFVGEAIAKLSR